MQNFSTKELTTTAIMSAFIFIATFVPKVPFPLGYAHLGDGAIFLAVIFFGRKIGRISASIGSALADLIGGFPIWIVPTLVIKFVMADIFSRLYDGKILSPRTIAAFLAACLWMTIEYILSGAILYGSLELSLAMTVGLLLKSLINIVAAIGIALAIKRVRF